MVTADSINSSLELRRAPQEEVQGMLSPNAFADLVEQALGRPFNSEQRKCVTAGTASPLLIIAGPGTGKTTVLVLRALRHLLVDGIFPEAILITTFTKKAAQEVRTRWLDWGLPLLDAALAHPDLQGADEQAWLRRVDLNRCVTGTLDSICEDLISEYRPAGTVTPVLVQGYPANQMLLRSGFSNLYYAARATVDAYLATYSLSGDAPRTQSDLVQASRPIMDRFIHDQVNVAGFSQATPHNQAKSILVDGHAGYQADLAGRSQMDFAMLELTFLQRVAQGQLDEAVLAWKAVLVDEYQDTNSLQESIYFEIVRRTGAALSVVGDDDQSLYRFRGATVELFTRFVTRLHTATARNTQTVYLTRNYRSTPEIVAFFNAFLANDPGFAPARINPPKPPIVPDRGGSGLPVLGMFRQDAGTLARDLATFLHDVFRNGGRRIDLPDATHTTLSGNADGGDFGDAIVLSHSVREYGRGFRGAPPPERMPLLLRREMAARGTGVFNPRGQALADQANVRVLLGLLLECLDLSDAAHPDGMITPGVTALTNAARATFAGWRQAAAAFAATNPTPGGLTAFLSHWCTRTSQTGEQWPDDWPLLELLFKLITWMPEFRGDPEHQVWLEAISRAAVQARLFSPYGGTIRNRAPHDERSRASIIRDILRPIADGMVDVDEELIPNVPRDRLGILTIHQSKGLEFPLVVVDIGSNFSRNHPRHAGLRFPTQASSVTMLEDDLAPFSHVGPARTARSALNRTFDDLVREYYVAYSRPQTALLLVGHDKTVATHAPVRNVAAWWRRDQSWAWHDPNGAHSTFANALPLVML